MSLRNPLLRTGAALLFAASSVVTPAARAADPPPATTTPPASRDAAPLGDNAVLRYWPAFHFLPKAEPPQEKVLDEWRTTAANDPAAAKLTAAADRSLLYLRAGAAVPRAAWGLDYNQGFGLLLPHAGQARNLSRLACLRAHQRALAGDATGAADDIADAITLGRHLTSDPILILILVRHLIESNAIDTAGDHLPRLKGPALDHLAARLDRLPQGGSAIDTVRTEQEFGQRWAAREVRSWAGKPDLKKRVLTLFTPPDDAAAAAEIERGFEAGGGTAEGIAAQLDALGPTYDELAAALKLPRDQAQKRVAEARDQAIGKNPFARLLLPAYGRTIDTEARGKARMAMLKAAIAIVQGGEGKLKDFKDPFGDGPFEYKPADGGGFELRSKLVVKDNEPVTLRVGMPAEPKQP